MVPTSNELFGEQDEAHTEAMTKKIESHVLEQPPTVQSVRTPPQTAQPPEVQTGGSPGIALSHNATDHHPRQQPQNQQAQPDKMMELIMREEANYSAFLDNMDIVTEGMDADGNPVQLQCKFPEWEDWAGKVQYWLSPGNPEGVNYAPDEVLVEVASCGTQIRDIIKSIRVEGWDKQLVTIGDDIQQRFISRIDKQLHEFRQMKKRITDRLQNVLQAADAAILAEGNRQEFRLREQQARDIENARRERELREAEAQAAKEKAERLNDPDSIEKAKQQAQEAELEAEREEGKERAAQTREVKAAPVVAAGGAKARMFKRGKIVVENPVVFFAVLLDENNRQMFLRMIEDGAIDLKMTKVQKILKEFGFENPAEFDGLTKIVENRVR